MHSAAVRRSPRTTPALPTRLEPRTRLAVPEAQLSAAPKQQACPYALEKKNVLPRNGRTTSLRATCRRALLRFERPVIRARYARSAPAPVVFASQARLTELRRLHAADRSVRFPWSRLFCHRCNCASPGAGVLR